MRIELNNHQILTGVLTAALIALGGYTTHKIQQIEKNKDNIALLSQKLNEHISDYQEFLLRQPHGKEAD